MCARSTTRIRGVAFLALIVLACACAAQSPTLPNGAARVLSVTGQVSTVRGADLWATKLNDVVPAGQEIVSGPDGHAILEVSDGSRFEVYPNSRVLFRPQRFDLRELLDVLIGKVRVHIEHFGGKPNPYRVNSPTALIAVRGTTFEVDVESDSATVVSVVQGVVDVRNLKMPGKTVQLTEGQMIRVLATEPLANLGPSHLDGVRSIMRTVVDTTLDAIRNGGIPTGGGSTPTTTAGGTTPTGTGGTVGTPTGTTSGSGSGSGTGTPPCAGRPGSCGTGGGDTGTGTVTPPTPGVPGGTTGGTTGGSGSTSKPGKKVGGN